MIKTRLLPLALVVSLFTPIHAQFKVIYNFGNGSSEPSCPTAAGTISQSPGGNLISTGGGGCTGSTGGAFELSPKGKNFTVLQNEFIGPYGGLTLGTDQRFHGTSADGGLYGYGTVFRISPKPFSAVAYEHDFAGGADGSGPYSAPIQSVGGHFYGTTSGTDGTVYRISASGQYSVLHRFTGPDGAHPVAPLVQASDYNFYGTTVNGGKFDKGTIFRITAGGDFKVLYHFDGVHGEEPYGPLIQARDGNFYGMATQGGANQGGVAFKMTPGGTLTVLHDFIIGGAFDGGRPYGGLVEATDGNLYGLSYNFGIHDAGTLFRLTPAGDFTKLYDFDDTTGANPETTLIQHTNGKLYGGAMFGGKNGAGTMFEYDLGLLPFVTYLPVWGRVGARVVILGQSFVDGESTVYFNGVPALNPEIHPTYIKATVPEEATTGLITVTTSRGTLKSNKRFIVH